MDTEDENQQIAKQYNMDSYDDEEHPLASFIDVNDATLLNDVCLTTVIIPYLHRLVLQLCFVLYASLVGIGLFLVFDIFFRMTTLSWKTS